MPHYSYNAVDRSGAKSQGQLVAANENELFQTLRNQGLSLVSCRALATNTHTIKNLLPLVDQALLARHLHTMLHAGVPVQDALSDILLSLPKQNLAKAVQHVVKKVEGGESLSAAFYSCPQRFDMLFYVLMKAGEKTGKLTQALEHLRENLEWKDEFRKKLHANLSLPMLQLVLAMFAVGVLIGVAIPQIMNLLGQIGSQMPLYATLLLGGVKILGFAFIVSLLLIGVVALLLPLLRHQGEGSAMRVDRFILRVPLLGDVVLKSTLAQLTHIFAAMLASGMQVMEVLTVLPHLTDNRALAADLDVVRQQVAGGKTLTGSLHQAMHLPPYMVRLFKVGEDGGTLGESLLHIAELYQKESQQAVEKLLKGTSLAITLVVGLVLSAMVMGVMYPLYNGLSIMVKN
jgi:type IV pilus assembly protein PilC